MGPRPEGHGENKTHQEILKEALSFNGATSRRTWREEIETGREWMEVLLQWGHVQKDMERAIYTFEP